jgi:hypothetical protein
MKVKRLIVLLTTSILLAGCSLPFGGKKAGIQVTANPQASVFMDNKSLGQTPVYQNGQKPGTYNVKISATDTTLVPWEGKVTLNPGVLTVIDRQLASDPTKAHGYTLSFETLTNKTATEVNLVSFPDTVSVTVDGAPVGLTPFKSDSIPAGAHSFTLTSPGYQDLVIKASVLAGQRLVISAQLGAQDIIPTPTPTPLATPSATLTPSVVEITPLPKQATSSAVPKPYVEILATPDNNHLKVRSENVIGNNIIAIVNSGDKFPYVSTSGSWYQIEYQKGLKGWVSATYAKLNN